MDDSELGLSDRDKELRKWNAPYRYQEYPRMLFRGVTTTAGRLEVEQRVVGSAIEQASAETGGWLAHPQRAIEVETAKQEAPGIAAAERAYRDRFMSERAQADAAQADAASARHLGAIPERPRRSHRTKKAD